MIPEHQVDQIKENNVNTICQILEYFNIPYENHEYEINVSRHDLRVPLSFYECALCNSPKTGSGNPCAPISTRKQDRCCDRCNDKFVIPARVNYVTQTKLFR